MLATPAPLRPCSRDRLHGLTGTTDASLCALIILATASMHRRDEGTSVAKNAVDVRPSATTCRAIIERRRRRRTRARAAPTTMACRLEVQLARSRARAEKGSDRSSHGRRLTWAVDIVGGPCDLNVQSCRRNGGEQPCSKGTRQYAGDLGQHGVCVCVRREATLCTRQRPRCKRLM